MSSKAGKPVINHMEKTVRMPASFVRAANEYGSPEFKQYMEMQQTLQGYHFIQMSHKTKIYKPSYEEIEIYFEVTNDKAGLKKFLSMRSEMTEVTLTEAEKCKAKYKRLNTDKKKVHKYKPLDIIKWFMDTYKITQEAMSEAKQKAMQTGSDDSATEAEQAA